MRITLFRQSSTEANIINQPLVNRGRARTNRQWLQDNLECYLAFNYGGALIQSLSPVNDNIVHLTSPVAHTRSILGFEVIFKITIPSPEVGVGEDSGFDEDLGFEILVGGVLEELVWTDVTRFLEMNLAASQCRYSPRPPCLNL